MLKERTLGSPLKLTEDAGDLARLLATEARLEGALQRAREQAAGLVVAARDAASAREKAFAARLSEDLSRLEAQVDEERRGREAALRAEAAREAEHFTALPNSRIEELARLVLSRVIGGDR